MSERQHTPEPWAVRDRGVGYEVVQNGEPVNREFRETFSRGDAERIAACVNACKGIADPETALHAMREALKHSERALTSLPVDALGMGHDDNHEWPLRDELLTQVRAALKLCEAK